MKKLLGIVVLGLLLSNKAYSRLLSEQYESDGDTGGWIPFLIVMAILGVGYAY